MQSKIWFINIVLALLIVVFGIRVYEVWFAPEKQSVKPKNSQASSAQPTVRLLPKTVLPQTSYQIIAEKTIFSPDRAEQVKKTDASAAPKAPAKFNLWGVMMLSDTDKRALISEVAATPKKRWIKEGDMLDDRKVISVIKDRIVLAGKDDQQEILLYDSAKLVRREQINKDQEPIVIAGVGETQAKAIPKVEKGAEATVVPPPEKKPEAQSADKKPAEPPKEKSKQPEASKPQPQPHPAADALNPFINFLKGIK